MNTEPEIYGNWEDTASMVSQHHQYMRCQADQLAAHWRRCSMTSLFWSRYTGLFIPTPAPSGHLSAHSMVDLLSFMLNELFENCAKFSGGPVDIVEYHSWIFPDTIVCEITNHILPERYTSFVQFITKLLNTDPLEEYIRIIEDSAATNAKTSGLGYIILLKDYGIRFGFRFTQVQAESIAVTIQAHVSREEF